MTKHFRVDDLDAWKIFLSVASKGSLNKAAVDLGIDVSSVSRKIEKLENHLGYALFVRSNRMCTLTPEGDHVIKEITPVMRLFTQTVAGLCKKPGDVRGMIRICLEAGLAHRALRWLSEFQDLYPQLLLEVHTITTPQEFQMTGWDLALWAKQEKQHFAESIDLGAVRTCMCTSPQYIAHYGKIRKISDLAKHRVLINGEWVCPLVMYDKTSACRFSFEAAKTLRMDSMAAIKEAALQGLGVAIGLPEYCCKEELADGRLVRILEHLDSLAMVYSIITPSKGPHPNRIELLINWLKRKWKEELHEDGLEIPEDLICSLG